MTDLEKAKELYLRGFHSTYVKRRTNVGISELKKTFPEIDKATIMKYQVNYLSSRNSIDEIAEALEKSLSVPNIDQQIHQKKMQILGCAFGAYDRVFMKLLGKTRFLEIKNRSRERSGEPSFKASQEKRRQTMLTRYGSAGPNGNPEIAARMMNTLKKTNQERYGVDFVMQKSEIAEDGAKRRQQAMIDKYGAGNSVQIPEIREKILESRKQNGTLTSSAHEAALYELLVNQFGIDDVERNYKDDRYLSYADFYIKSRDIFIELNGDRSHEGHWFDESNPKDIDRVAWMKKRAEEIDAKRKFSSKEHKSRYWNSIRVWTILDVEKRRLAREHNLNYLVFWDAAMRVIDGVKQPRLKDAREWIAAGCPDSKDWKKENTW